jgi:uncharacterized SAM-binding protein YcdF (DUF218 family)
MGGHHLDGIPLSLLSRARYNRDCISAAESLEDIEIIMTAASLFSADHDGGERPMAEAKTAVPAQIESDARTIYNYHRLSSSNPSKPQPADAIFTLCSLDTRVARYAAQLFLSGLAPWLIFSGNVGALTAGRFAVAEAEHFAAIARDMGVPGERIIIEPKARNTGENVRFVHALLERRGLLGGSQSQAAKANGADNVLAQEADTKSERPITRMLLVQKPYMERRTYATFAKQWPGVDAGSMRFSVTSPPIAWEDYPDAENPRELVISIMVGDLVRIREYPKLGFQIEQDIPDEVWEAGMRLKGAGCNRHLP